MSFLDDVAEELKAIHRPKGWFYKLPEATRNELLELRTQYRAGTLSMGAGTLAIGISRALAKRKTSISMSAIKKWLLEKAC